MASERPENRVRIPSKITRDHIFKAIKEIDKKGWDKENDSIKYDLIFEGKRYPPKIVVKYANFFWNGELLDVSKFTGGEDTTNKFFRDRGFEIDFKPRSSEALILNQLVSREELKKQFKITDATINNGIFKPKGFSSVWLFVTERKTPDRTQYEDYFDGFDLHFQGQTKKKSDHLIIDHENEGNEILVFYRKMKNEFQNFGFQYRGKFSYRSSFGESTPGPTHFILISHEIPPEDEDEKEQQEDNPEITHADSTYFPSGIEGKEKTRIQTYYERNPGLRSQAIKLHGTKCKICNFDFGKTYGKYGEGFIEIHHIIPHSSMKGEHRIDPKMDLIPVCSNCHRVIHRPSEGWLTLEQMKKIFQ